MKTLRLIAPALLAIALLAACGNKGDLVLPEPPTETPADAPAAATDAGADAGADAA